MDYQNRYQQWLEHLADSDPLKEELLSIRDDEEEIEDRFYQELAFGTAGLRGKVGAGTNRMNLYTVGKATQGIADFIISHGQEAMDKGVVIARDPRHFSKEFCELTAAVFAANGIRVYIYPGIRPTAQLAFTIRRLGTVSGIMITASHNPKEYNGYKAYWDDGCQVSSQIADQMGEAIRAVDIWNGVRVTDFAEAAADGNRQAARAVLRADERQDFLDEVVVVILLTRSAPALIAPDIRPRLAVHRIDGKELDLARFDLRCNRIDHAEVLKVVAHRILRRQDEQRRTRMAVDADVHLALQAVTVPGSVFSLHNYHVLFAFTIGLQSVYSFLV